MITVKQLQPTMVSISTNLKGVKTFQNDLTNKQLEEQIKNDITSNLDGINKINIDCDIEDYDDIRTLKKCTLVKIEMLIQFKNSNQQHLLKTVTKYLKYNFVKTI